MTDDEKKAVDDAAYEGFHGKPRPIQAQPVPPGNETQPGVPANLDPVKVEKDQFVVQQPEKRELPKD